MMSLSCFGQLIWKFFVEFLRWSMEFYVWLQCSWLIDDILPCSPNRGVNMTSLAEEIHNVGGIGLRWAGTKSWLKLTLRKGPLHVLSVTNRIEMLVKGDVELRGSVIQMGYGWDCVLDWFLPLNESSIWECIFQIEESCRVRRRDIRKYGSFSYLGIQRGTSEYLNWWENMLGIW